MTTAGGGHCQARTFAVSGWPQFHRCQGQPKSITETIGLAEQVYFQIE
jgi:hypothetical protein